MENFDRIDELQELLNTDIFSKNFFLEYINSVNIWANVDKKTIKFIRKTLCGSNIIGDFFKLSSVQFHGSVDCNITNFSSLINTNNDQLYNAKMELYVDQNEILNRVKYSFCVNKPKIENIIENCLRARINSVKKSTKALNKINLYLNQVYSTHWLSIFMGVFKELGATKLTRDGALIMLFKALQTGRFIGDFDEMGMDIDIQASSHCIDMRSANGLEINIDLLLDNMIEAAIN